jgi:XTP/dITP diphosphohydrolase
MLRELRGIPMARRQARYRCVAALTDGEKIVAVVSGSCEGLVAERSKGKNGFGYDPLFLIPEYNKTFGQLDPAIKAGMSHRAKAMAKMKRALKILLSS